MMKDMRYRQVHLDFHTSPAIGSVGERFSKKQFTAALKAGRVNSVTVFSKCHHGYSYHPTEVNEMHPGLKFDLLGAQLEACREADINAPVYISAGLDEKAAVVHPEWLSVGSPSAGNDFVGSAHYHLLCFNTPYLDLLTAQVGEVMRRYNPVGLFLDISDVRHCYCSRCLASMRKKGRNPLNAADVHAHGEEVYAEYCRRIKEEVYKYNPETAIFHNAGNIARGRRDLAYQDTHLELESLPTGGWGYDHFPMSAAYVRSLGMEYLGMTGKFHTTWGEFGGFKHPNALRYETALSVAFGAKCSIGDQLHPDGEMNASTYRLIGAAYKEIEAGEAWCRGASAVSDIAILSAEAFSLRDARHNAPDTGAARMLLEGKYLFDIIDLETPLENYKLIILPDRITPGEALATRLNSYLAGGGKILATGESGLNPEKTGFALKLGAVYEGPNPYKPSYMIPDEGIGTVNGVTSYVMYEQAQNIVPDTGAKVFAYLAEPYFNRTPEHFCSHQHTPDKPDSLRGAAVFTGKTAYIGWNVFEDYAVKGSLCLKELVTGAIEMLIGSTKTVKAENLPDRGIVTLTRQPAQNRFVCHVLFAHTCLRGKGIEVIEDAVPLHNVGISVKCPEKPKSVKLVPDMRDLPFTYGAGSVSFTVPEFLIHQMIEIGF